MSRLRGAAALLPALLSMALLCGCAALGGGHGAAPAAAQGTEGSGTLPDTAAAGKQGVEIVIDAPDDLKALLKRHLDLVRLGRTARDEVDDTEWSRLIDAAPAQVRELLQTEGYFTPQVMLERDPGRAAGQGDFVRLQVDPGSRVRVSRATLEIEGDLERAATAGDEHAVATLAQWRGAWPLAAGSEFRNPAWSEAKAAGLARLRAAGYANAAWVGTGAEVDVPNNRVRLFVVAESGPLFRYGSLDIEGLATHDADTVRHLAAMSRGAPVTETAMLDFQERLQKSGLFENVSVTLDTDAAHADEARIIVRLREAPLQVYTVGAGISANTGPRMTLEHTWRRVFGWAASVRNKVEWGQKRQYWEGELSSHPTEGLYRNLIGGTVERLISDSDTVLSQRVRTGRTQDTQRIERLYYIEAERSRRVTITNETTNAVALSLNYHGVWRELDSVVLPTEGFSFAGQLGVGRSHGTDADPGFFTRAYARLTGYLPLWRTWYSQARIEVGGVFMGSRMVVPDSQKFRAGGEDSVRGYGYRDLGPLVNGVVGGGDALYTVSFELARPFVTSMPTLWGAMFVDAGNAADTFSQLHPAVGMGVGLRWRSPAGPLRIDWAWAPQTRKSRLHFSVGIAF